MFDPHATQDRAAKPPRYRCPVCGQYPTLTSSGALRQHAYPWHHSQSGDHCPGSGTQITPLEGQTTISDLDPETSTPTTSDSEETP